MGLAFALTLPGLVVVLVAVAFADQALLRLCGRGLVPWRRDAQVSSTGSTCCTPRCPRQAG